MSNESQTGLTKCDSNPAYGVVTEPGESLVQNIAYGERRHNDDNDTPSLSQERQLQGVHLLDGAATAVESTGEEYIYIEPQRPLESSAATNTVPETVSLNNSMQYSIN